MCGYTYYINLSSNKKFNQNDVNKILKLQTHRGPDFAKIGTKILLQVRGKKHGGHISTLPFYKKNYVK